MVGNLSATQHLGLGCTAGNIHILLRENLTLESATHDVIKLIMLHKKIRKKQTMTNMLLSPVLHIGIGTKQVGNTDCAASRVADYDR